LITDQGANTLISTFSDQHTSRHCEPFNLPTMAAPKPVRILIINPNTSTHMTEALRPVVEDLSLPGAKYTYFTCPSTATVPGINSINSPDDSKESAKLCLPHLKPLLPDHDAFLVACYSEHPLVGQLKHECEVLRRKQPTSGSSTARKYVTGIFEASVVTSLSLLSLDLPVIRGAEKGEQSYQDEPGLSESPSGSTTEATGPALVGGTFGIVSTGVVWEEALRKAVNSLMSLPHSSSDSSREISGLGPSTYGRFAGCQTTGLNASELHSQPDHVVREKMIDATKRLLQGVGITDYKEGKTVSRVQAICLGCAGMVGLESAVRQACVEELGEEAGKGVQIVDGVKAGVATLYGQVRMGL
jgi:Asp/Glu/hydantoin racemase